MTTASPPTHGRDLEAGPRFSTAGRFVEHLAAWDFEHLAETMADDVVLRALLPSGPHQYPGSDAVSAAFAGWFGNAVGFEVLDVSIGEVCDRLHLRWRVRVRTADRRYVVEQQVYADTGADDQFVRLDLLCSGYRPEVADG